MKLVTPQMQFFHLCIRYLDAFLVARVVQRRLDIQPALCRRMTNQIDDRRQAVQRVASPVLADKREQSVLDLVPLACPRRKMTDRHGQPYFIGQVLKFNLP